MAQYLVQVAYTTQALATLVSNPQDPLAIVAKAAKKLGGKLNNGWLTFGDFDTAVVVTFPDNVAAAAFSLALSAGGAWKSVHTTPLLTVEEGLAAMKAAGTAGYQPPIA